MSPPMPPGVETNGMDKSPLTDESTVDSKATRESENGDENDQPTVDIAINNVVCSFSVGCHLNLRDIVLRGINVEFDSVSNVSGWIDDPGAPYGCT